MRRRTQLLVVYLLVTACALTWPGLAWVGGRAEPFVLGLPWSLAWNVAWVIATFLVLAVYHWFDTREGQS